MNIKTAWSTNKNSHDAIQEAYQSLLEQLGAQPHWLFLCSTVKHNNHKILQWLHTHAPHVTVHGGTSYMGLMTQEGYHSEDGFGLGLWGIEDAEGSYNLGMAASSQNAFSAGAQAATQAMGKSNTRQDPAFLWLTCAPGNEEMVIQGIEKVTQNKIPIIGGSAADNTLEGKWQQFANHNIYSDGVVVTAMYPSTQVHYFFWSGGYSPSTKRGIITKARGRTILEIDSRPAAQVYDEWTGGRLHDAITRGGNILTYTGLSPLAREASNDSFIRSYYLAQPAAVTEEGGLTLFAAIYKGEEVILMNSSVTDLITRSGLVSQFALKKGRVLPRQVAGSLLIYCAGCRMLIEDKLPQVVQRINASLDGSPFLGMFTLGEQGCFKGNENYHGNLMTSIVVFSK